MDSGTTLMSIVPLDQVWVDANFKESQLNTMRLGQKVVLSADLYGDKVEYQGTIESLGIGTGSAFSLLPAQNASGNWIKIVQRLPVRITLDPHDMEKHPLRVGLSMFVRVDIRDTDGHLLPQQTVAAPRFTTDVYQNALDEADHVVAKILHDNSQAVAATNR